MATKEEYVAAAKSIKRGLFWDQENQIFYCEQRMIELMAKNAVDAAEAVRLEIFHMEQQS